MRELLEKLLAYFKEIQSQSCKCNQCREARAWIAKIEKELNDTSPKIDTSDAAK